MKRPTARIAHRQPRRFALATGAIQIDEEDPGDRVKRLLHPGPLFTTVAAGPSGYLIEDDDDESTTPDADADAASTPFDEFASAVDGTLRDAINLAVANG